MKSAKEIKQEIRKLKVESGDEIHSRVIDGLAKVLDKSTKQTAVKRPITWRMIMKSKIMKSGIAAVLILTVVSVYGWISRGERGMSGFSLLTQACAAEEAIFASKKIIHIINEIIVYPTSGDSERGEAWLPMTSLKPDGKFRMDQLKFPTDVDRPYTVSDQAWYDPMNGRFARIIKKDENTVFANSYDGESIYTFESRPDGSLQVVGKPVSENFMPPAKPAEFLGLTTGLRGFLQKETPEVQEIDKGVLEDGSGVRIFKVGTADPEGSLRAYWLFKIRIDDGTNAENEFVIDGKTRLIMRRVLSESVENPGISWDLAEINRQNQNNQESPKVSVAADMVIPNVSVRHMVERASFETCIFAKDPSRTGEWVITDCIDPPSPGERMFIISYRANDGRHIVLVQSKTYNLMLGTKVKQCQLVYTSPGGFKLWAIPAEREKWLANILLSSARAFILDAPADDRSCFVLESPSGVFSALAINGKLTDEELHQLMNSLVPAKNYQE